MMAVMMIFVIVVPGFSDSCAFCHGTLLHTLKSRHWFAHTSAFCDRCCTGAGFRSRDGRLILARFIHGPLITRLGPRFGGDFFAYTGRRSCESAGRAGGDFILVEFCGRSAVAPLCRSNESCTTKTGRLSSKTALRLVFHQLCLGYQIER